jgi:hypothetical protein
MALLIIDYGDGELNRESDMVEQVRDAFRIRLAAFSRASFFAAS